MGLSPAAQGSILSTVVLLVVLWILRKLLVRIASRRQTDSRKFYQWKKTINYVVTGFGIIFLSNIWFNGFESIATFLGLLSAGLVVALRDPITNMFGWLFLIWKRPFRVGDRIEINDYVGDVIDITFFQFTLNELGQWVDSDQATGRVVHIPNGQVFTNPQINYSYIFPFLWNEIKVLVTFESNWQKAKSILEEIAIARSVDLNEATAQRVKIKAQRHLIFYKDFKPKVFTKVRRRGVKLTIRYLCNINGRRESENQIWEDIITQFLQAPDISFAYPTTRFYQPPEELGLQKQQEKEQ